ncbi:MAG: TIGR03790 family protein [Armatimonadetes bacterium]|nr:TIGR03790 family protein [Armatimonadota bacterium]
MLTAVLLAPIVYFASSATADASHVLVVINTASSDSRSIGAYYRQKRNIPKDNVVTIDCSQTENVSMDEFTYSILKPIQKAARASKTRIDYIVMTKGIPIRLGDNGGAGTDAWLAVMNRDLRGISKLNEEEIRRCTSPYFEKKEHFDSSKFNMYLVTRLDGYTVEDAKALVDHAVAAKPVDGPFYLDEAENRKTGGYGELQGTMETAANILRKAGKEAVVDKAPAFGNPGRAVMGYVSWGSNDGKFSESVYKSVKFLPGAISETFVSTSGRTFKHTTGGQSLIADLIASGVTGVKGYVSEPYTFALARPDILFDRYVSGFNLAESFYMASPVLKWKDVVIGDPLCNPYGS